MANNLTNVFDFNAGCLCHRKICQVHKSAEKIDVKDISNMLINDIWQQKCSSCDGFLLFYPHAAIGKFAAVVGISRIFALDIFQHKIHLSFFEFVCTLFGRVREREEESIRIVFSSIVNGRTFFSLRLHFVVHILVKNGFIHATQSTLLLTDIYQTLFCQIGHMVDAK